MGKKNQIDKIKALKTTAQLNEPLNPEVEKVADILKFTYNLMCNGMSNIELIANELIKKYVIARHEAYYYYRATEEVYNIAPKKWLYINTLIHQYDKTQAGYEATQNLDGIVEILKQKTNLAKLLPEQQLTEAIQPAHVIYTTDEKFLGLGSKSVAKHLEYIRNTVDAETFELIMKKSKLLNEANEETKIKGNGRKK